jgi:hypothetical protein
MTDIILPWSNNLVLWVIQKFIPMSKPSNNSRDHEKNWEHVSRESHCLVNNATIEINIRIKFSLNKILIAQSNLFQLHCDFNKLLFSSDFENFISNFFDDFSPRIITLVNSVTKSIQ